MTILATILGITLPSLLLAAAVRRWYAPVPWRTALLFLGMTFGFLHGAVFSSRIPVPVDEVARGYPWRGVVGEVSVRNPLTNDTAKLFLPWMKVAREELLHLRAPLWNRYSFSGYPLLGNGESAPFSPLFLATLFVPLPKQIVAMAGLKIFAALLFGYCFARRQELSEWSSCFAASAFAFSVFQTVFLYYSTTAVTAFLPAALFALSLALERGLRRDAVLVAIVVATLLANGHPESVLHVATVAGGLFAIEFGLSTDRRRWLADFRTPLFGAAAGLAIAAPAWVPVLEQVLLSSRLAELRAASAHAAAYPLASAWAMVSPNIFGNPVRQNWSWISNYSLVAASYAGLLVLAWFGVAVVSRTTGSRHRLWAVFAVFLWLVAMAWTPVGQLASSIPPFSITANDKLRFGAVFLASIVAGAAIDRRTRRDVIALGVFGALLVAAATYAWSVKRNLVEGSDLIAPATVVLGFAATCLRRERTALVAFLALTGELFVLNSGFNPLVDRRYYRPPVPLVEAIARAAPSDPFRVAGLEWMFVPNASAEYGLEDVRGSDPMSYASYTRLLAPIVLDDRSIDLDRIVTTEHRLFDLLNVRFLLTEPSTRLQGRWREVYRGPDGAVYENPGALSRFFVLRGDADVAIRQFAPGWLRVDVDARTPVVIGSSQGAGPGWRVTADGDGVRRSDESAPFVGFHLPAGRARVDVRYLPWSFYGAIPVSLLGLALLHFTPGRLGVNAME